MNKTPPPTPSAAPAILGILLLASVAGNVALGMQLLGPAKPGNTVWLSSQSTVRGTLSGEERLASGDITPEYDYAFGMRKNLQLSKDNCLLDECFLNMNLKLPVGQLLEAYASSLADIAKKEHEVALMLNSVRAVQKDSPLLNMAQSEDVRTAVLGFLEAKYGVAPKAAEQGVPLGNAAATCKQLHDNLLSLEKAYATELARTDMANHPDLDYAYRQLVTQTRNVHLPLAQSCAK